MRQDTVELYQQIKAVYGAMLPELDASLASIQGNRDMQELVDLAYAMREFATYADELRKQAKKIQDTAEKVACVVWVESQETQIDKAKIKTPYVTGSPSVQFMGRLPDKKKQPEEFAKLMEFFKIPENLWKTEEVEESSAVKFHWPGMITLLSNMMAEGKPLPPGIDPDTTFPVYSMPMRKRKAVDDGAPEAAKLGV